MEHKWKTACPLNCFDVCGFVVTEEGGKIIDISGDPTHPITKGKICGKGKKLKDRIYDPRRILYPHKKVDGKFIRISWQQALAEISKKMADIEKQYGPTAVMHSYDYASGGLLKGLDQRFFNFFGGLTEVKGSLCWGAGIEAQYYDFGDSLSHDVSDIENAKTITIWGRNITTTNMHLLHFLKDAKRKGTKIIVIDPIKNEIAKYADLYLAIQPGMDGLLALAISKIIIEKDWLDRSFIENHSLGFSDFKQELTKIDLNQTAEQTNLDKESIYQLANIYANEKPVMTFLGLGMQRYKNGGNTIRAIDALSALSGNIGISGGGVNYANLAVGRSFNWTELLREDLRKEYRVFYRPTQADEILNSEDPPVKMVFITRSNAVTQLPNIDKTLAALNKIETKIVIDMFFTDTALQADYVLPTTSVFEEEDIYYGSMFHGVFRYGPKLIDPPGEAWTDLKIWIEFAKKLGLTGFEKTTDEFLEIALKPLNKYGINLKSLKDKKQFELQLAKIPWEDKKFSTPSGKFEFYSEQAKKNSLNPTAAIVYPKESRENNSLLKEKYPYNLLSIHPVKSLHSQKLFPEDNNLLPTVILPVKIAEEQAIKENDTVTVFNDRGKIYGKAKIKNNINRNTIVIEEGYWLNSNGSANKLTDNEASDMGNGSILYDCAVNILPIHLI